MVLFPGEINYATCTSPRVVEMKLSLEAQHNPARCFQRVFTSLSSSPRTLKLFLTRENFAATGKHRLPTEKGLINQISLHFPRS